MFAGLLVEFGLSSRNVLARGVLRVVVLAAVASAAVVAGSSSARAAAPVFLESDMAPEAKTVTLLAVGDNQTKVGPPVRAVDADGDALTYSLSDGGLLHASFFTIDSSSGQISRKPNTRQGVYQVRVTVSDGTDTDMVDVTIHVTSPGEYPWEDSWVQARALDADDGSANDQFGTAVAGTDEIIVVGAWLADNATLTGSSSSASPGAVYVFDADSGAQLARLDSPNAVAGGWFGFRVSVAGDTIFVGAPGETVSSMAKTGRVYVFNKPVGGWASTSTANARLQPDSTIAAMGGASAGVEFGWGLSVSDDGNTVAVGAPKWENVGDSGDVSGLDRDGAVFVFTKLATGWANAETDDTGVVRLYAGSRVSRYDELGKSVAVSGDGSTIAAGAPFREDAQGYVYVFTKTGTSWASTLATNTPVRLSATGRFRQERLGLQDVALSDDGSTLVAGAPVSWRKGAADDLNIPADAVGAAYVFTRPAGGWADATETAKLSTFGHKYDLFGNGAAISDSGNKIAVANATSRSSNYRGSVYVFTKPDGGWADDLDGAGDDVRVLTAADADTNANHRNGFGGLGLAFIGEDDLVVGQRVAIAALRRKDRLATLPAGGLYGDNVDQSNLDNVSQGSAYLFKLRTAQQQQQQQQQPVAPPPPDEPEEPTAPEPVPPVFVDVGEDSVHAESIEEVAVLGITSGTTGTTFSPSESVSRGQMATFVARAWEAAGRECPSTGFLYFDDVAAGSTHAAGIDCVSALGVARGTADRMFSPSESVSRGQMATFLARAWKAAGRTCPDDASSSFDDVPADSTHAAGINCVAALGITRGTAAGMFSPSDTVTRAQMASFLARFYEALTDTA